jgi:putative lipoprotein
MRFTRFRLPLAAALSGAALLASYSCQTSYRQHRGFYVFGHEVRTFQPCGSRDVYWVRASNEISRRLRDEHQRMTTKPYEEVYVEVTGRLTEKAKEGFAVQYDGQIIIDDVSLIRSKKERDCLE